MRIALRTGGGRGVYELAGSHGKFKASDFFEKELFYEITPELILPGRARADKRQGKPRIKLDDLKRTTHLYRLISGILFLPKPKREFKTTSGKVLVKFNCYSITVIKIDVSFFDDKKVIVRPTDVILANSEGLEKRVSFIDRMSRIMNIWKKADSGDSAIHSLVRDHKKSIYRDDVNFMEVEKSCLKMIKHIGTDYDPLKIIESSLGISYDYESEETNETVIGSSFGLDDNNSTEISKVESIKKWRKMAVRGSDASKFRSIIRDAYDDTCIFTGQRLNKLESIASAGVDAAHILPWSSFNINSVDNGICINKLCHWAFDSGLMRLDFDESNSKYLLSIPEKVRLEAENSRFDLDYFLKIEGVIPEGRFPSSREHWPNPNYLKEFNKIMYENSSTG